jgi:hypothetical protein
MLAAKLMSSELKRSREYFCSPRPKNGNCTQLSSVWLEALGKLTRLHCARVTHRRLPRCAAGDIDSFHGIDSSLADDCQQIILVAAEALYLAAVARMCQQKSAATLQVLAHLQVIGKNDPSHKQKSLAFVS